ncbi:hypothetical protein BH09MYX1_BH09MYX1_40530 [soil metagenome]
MKKQIWLLPAAGSFAFSVFSVRTMVAEGPLGFVDEHLRNGWSAQIGIDLLSSATVALFFGAPLARRHGIRMLPWVVLTILTGSVGLLAFAARILHARGSARLTSAPRAPSGFSSPARSLPPAST